MGVSQRQGRGFTHSPSHSDLDVSTPVAVIMQAIAASEDDLVGGRGEGSGCATSPYPDPGTARTLEQWVSPADVRDELVVLERQATNGDAESARRAAELYEALHEFTTAADWWRQAANLGDQDAIDHVRYILP